MSRTVSMQFGKPIGAGQGGGSSTTTLTPEVTRTAGASSVEGVYAVRSGNVISLVLELMPTGTTNAGSNIFEGTLSDIPLPALSAAGSGFMGSCAFIGDILSTGDIQVRCLAENRASSTTHFFVRWTYICG